MSLPAESDAINLKAAPLLSAAFEILRQNTPLPEVDVGPLEPGFTPIAGLFADDRFLGAMLARQQASTPGLDGKGAAAYLIAEYAGIVSSVTAVAFLTAGVVPVLDPENCALAFEMPAPGSEDAPRVRVRFLTSAFTTDRAGLAAQSSAIRLVDREGLRDELRRGLEHHFDSLITRLHLKTRLPPRAMWRLVADAAAARFMDVGQRTGTDASAKREALAILKQPGSPLMNPQLHFFDVVIREETTPHRVIARRSFRARGGCCRFYTAQGGSYCTTCVLVDPREQRRRIEIRMRRQLGLPVPEDSRADAQDPKEAS